MSDKINTFIQILVRQITLVFFLIFNNERILAEYWRDNTK